MTYEFPGRARLDISSMNLRCSSSIFFDDTVTSGQEGIGASADEEPKHSDVSDRFWRTR